MNGVSIQLNNRSQTNGFCYQLLDGFHQTKPHLSTMKCTFSRFVNVVGQLFVKVTTPTVQRNAPNQSSDTLELYTIVHMLILMHLLGSQLDNFYTAQFILTNFIITIFDQKHTVLFPFFSLQSTFYSMIWLISIELLMKQLLTNTAYYSPKPWFSCNFQANPMM